MPKIELFPAAWLVWVRGSGGQATPQIWHEPFIGTSGNDVLARHRLPVDAETNLSLNSLAELYPCEPRSAA